MHAWPRRSILAFLILLGAAAVAVAQSPLPEVNIVPQPVSLTMLTRRLPI